MADNTEVLVTNDEKLGPIEVVVDGTDVTPEQGEARVEKQPSQASAEEELAQIKEQARTYREAAERERRAKLTAQSEVVQAKASAADGQYGMILNAIDAETANLENAKKEAIAASESADWAKAAEANAKIGRVAAKLEQYEGYKGQWDQQRAQQKASPQPAQQQEQPIDIVEDWASRLTPRSAAWVRDHGDIVRNENSRKRLAAAHTAAVDLEGHAVDSDAYFSYLENKMGINTRQPPREQPAVQARTSSSSYSAPVTRDVPATNGNSTAPRRVNLSAEEREQARHEGMTDKEWAAAKLAAMDYYPGFGRTGRDH